jgi:hypothetical protein
MYVDIDPSAFPFALASEAHAEECAASAEAKQENTKQISELRENSNDRHVAEHIRAVVAVTMAGMTIHATDSTRSHAEHWQQWALGIADGLDLPVSGC